MHSLEVLRKLPRDYIQENFHSVCKNKCVGIFVEALWMFLAFGPLWPGSSSWEGGMGSTSKRTAGTNIGSKTVQGSFLTDRERDFVFCKRKEERWWCLWGKQKWAERWLWAERLIILWKFQSISDHVASPCVLVHLLRRVGDSPQNRPQQKGVRRQSSLYSSSSTKPSFNLHVNIIEPCNAPPPNLSGVFNGNFKGQFILDG